MNENSERENIRGGDNERGRNKILLFIHISLVHYVCKDGMRFQMFKCGVGTNNDNLYRGSEDGETSQHSPRSLLLGHGCLKSSTHVVKLGFVYALIYWSM